jgi:hypothetical protein
MSNDKSGISGEVTWELRGPDGNLKGEGKAFNLITTTGDTVYADRGAGVTGAPAAPTGMKLGSGSTAPAKTGAGAALVTYLSNSHQAFDGGYPVGATTTGRQITYRVTYAAGKATTAAAITEAVIVNDAIADATSAAGATVARVLLTGIGSKGASDTLTVTWNHTLTGA